MRTFNHRLRPRKRLARATLLAMTLAVAGLLTAAPAFAKGGGGAAGGHGGGSSHGGHAAAHSGGSSHGSHAVSHSGGSSHGGHAVAHSGSSSDKGHAVAFHGGGSSDRGHPVDLRAARSDKGPAVVFHGAGSDKGRVFVFRGLRTDGRILSPRHLDYRFELSPDHKFVDRIGFSRFGRPFFFLPFGKGAVPFHDSKGREEFRYNIPREYLEKLDGLYGSDFVPRFSRDMGLHGYLTPAGMDVEFDDLPGIVNLSEES